ncbi:basic leucine zipper 23-like protein [Tanacetum coccineum]
MSRNILAIPNEFVQGTIVITLVKRWSQQRGTENLLAKNVKQDSKSSLKSSNEYRSKSMGESVPVLLELDKKEGLHGVVKDDRFGVCGVGEIVQYYRLDAGKRICGQGPAAGAQSLSIPNAYNQCSRAFSGVHVCSRAIQKYSGRVVSIMAMEDGELDFSNHRMFSGSNVGDIPRSGSMTSFFDDIFNDVRACTHTHTCNPPGPVSSHTHTCYHVHTKIIPPMSNDDKIPSDDAAESSEKKGKQHSKGNRDAVKKYRDKKKARAASLEDEAELRRLKSLLVDTRGRIDGELGCFPYQK